MKHRPPPTLLGGRVRTSTVGLSLLFLAVLALYIAVRPAPTVTSDPAKLQRVGRPAPASPEPSASSVAPSRAPAPAATPTASGAPTTLASPAASAPGLPSSHAPSSPVIPTATP